MSDPAHTCRRGRPTQQRRRIRRTALVLGLVALGIYAAFIASGVMQARSDAARHPADRTREQRRSPDSLLLMVAGSFAFGFALVPLYDVICEAAGIRVNETPVGDHRDHGRRRAARWRSSSCRSWRPAASGSWCPRRGR